MKAIRVMNVFGFDWKNWSHRNDYAGHEHEFMYRGVEWLPLDVALEHGYLINECHIEDLDMEVI